MTETQRSLAQQLLASCACGNAEACGQLQQITSRAATGDAGALAAMEVLKATAAQQVALGGFIDDAKKALKGGKDMAINVSETAANINTLTRSMNTMVKVLTAAAIGTLVLGGIAVWKLGRR